MQSITLASVGHYFENQQQKIDLFNDINLTIEAGKSYAIVGQSGAGKSSLLTLAAGLETPKRGKVSAILDGKSADNMALRRESGFIFQQFHLLPELDAISNVALPLKLKGDKRALEKARESLNRIGLGERERHYPSQLSGGEQQRVAIARAFTNASRFIFADEPTGNLDETTASQVSKQLFEFSKSNQSSLLVVTHSKELASNADHIFRLSHGKLAEIQ